MHTFAYLFPYVPSLLIYITAPLLYSGSHLCFHTSAFLFPKFLLYYVYYCSSLIQGYTLVFPYTCFSLSQVLSLLIYTTASLFYSGSLLFPFHITALLFYSGSLLFTVPLFHATIPFYSFPSLPY